MPLQFSWATIIRYIISQITLRKLQFASSWCRF